MSNPERQLSGPNRQPFGREIARFLGGSPLSVAVRLAMLSIIVGVILSAFGLDPLDIVESIDALFRTVWNMGFDAVIWCGAISCSAQYWLFRSGSSAAW